ncbi:hypothetical protein Q9966_014215 [Columba livia]|nr:hypothetical protein Q9966_014215 [Columba livia]
MGAQSRGCNCKMYLTATGLLWKILYFWRAKVYASGNPEEEIDLTYVIIGVTLGTFLAISFVAVIICMIKKQMLDNAFGGEMNDFVMTAKFNIFNDDLTLTPLMILCPSLQPFDQRSNMGSSQNRCVLGEGGSLVEQGSGVAVPGRHTEVVKAHPPRDDVNVLGKQSTDDQ